VIVVTSTAAHAETAVDCAESVRTQTEPHAHWFACADAFTLERAQGRDTHTFLSAKPCLANLIDMWLQCDDADVIVHLDGDDWLPDDRVLERVAADYASDRVWLTYGSFERSDGVRDHVWDSAFGLAYEINNPVRQQRWRASHLKTFRAGLVKRLIHTAGECLLDLRGFLFDTCIDRAVMLPLLELSGTHYRVANDVRCVYHWRGAEHVTAPQMRRENLDRTRIHMMRPLAALTERPW
jgi:hypothetical protein